MPTDPTSLSHLTPLLDAVASRHLPVDSHRLVSAYRFAAAAHQEQVRKTGEPYITHPVAVATLLTRHDVDTETLCAALLHDVVEDCDVTTDEVRDRFGPVVAHLVDGVTKLDRLDAPASQRKLTQQAETLRKLVVSMADDLRVVLIKLADRLHNLQTIDPMPRHKQQLKAQETLEIYVPLAHRLGVTHLKDALEEEAFRVLEPDQHAAIRMLVEQRMPQHKRATDLVVERIEKRLEQARISAQVTGRPKTIFSVYEKMTRRGVPFDQIMDLIGVRIIVDDVADCYTALGVVHTTYQPVPGRFKDWIALPKFNLYQSLHTVVVGPDANPVEVQIRTQKMHTTAERGAAAHWRYKQAPEQVEHEPGPASAPTAKWAHDLADWQADVADPNDYLAALRSELAAGDVLALTPGGDVITLPTGATCLDFAYAIHSEVGHHAVSARINGQPAVLGVQVRNGDTVEIVTDSANRPTRSWLDIAVSSRARARIRRRLAEQGDETIRLIRSSHSPATGARVASCCDPHQGDPTTGYVTRSGRLTVHRSTCGTLARTLSSSPERQVDTWWAETTDAQPREVDLVCTLRLRMLGDRDALETVMLAADAANTRLLSLLVSSEQPVVDLTVSGSASQVDQLCGQLRSLPLVEHVDRV